MMTRLYSLPDGVYYYIATVTDGTHTLVRDLTNTNGNGGTDQWFDGLNIQPFDPFNNQPMILNYVPGVAKVTIAMSTQVGGDIVGDCNYPTAEFFCVVSSAYQAGSAATFRWAGLDPFGVYRGDTVRSVGVVAFRSQFPVNAIVLCGTAPGVGNVTVMPPISSPGNGSQTVAFDLTTYQNSSVGVVIEFMNLDSRSVLRTITLGNQAAGHITASWDGRADNGMFVAPGRYAVTVTVTDSRDNNASGQILTTVQY